VQVTGTEHHYFRRSEPATPVSCEGSDSEFREGADRTKTARPGVRAMARVGVADEVELKELRTQNAELGWNALSSSDRSFYG